MNNPTDQKIADLLKTSRTIALVGHSAKPERASYKVSKYLREHGYTVYPVNPVLDEVDGLKVYASLDDLPGPVDIVDVFRRSEFLPEIARKAASIGAKTVWGQLEVVHEEAVQIAAEAGINLVMDRCIKIEHTRLIIPGKD